MSPSLLSTVRARLRMLHSLRAAANERSSTTSLQVNRKSLPYRLADVFLRTWDLGFTAFGGPPVHFQILHQRFVEGRGGKEKWVDEQTYQEIFATCQALPGPASTKLLFCLALIHAGFIPAVFVFLLWSLPGAIGMYALSLGVQRINEFLPDPVYALLSGLNASTVGIIALAAVQLAEKAIRDKLTRIQVILGACAGLCYNSLWYFPLLIIIGGIATVVWDCWLTQKVGRVRAKWHRRRANPGAAAENAQTDSIHVEEREEVQTWVQRRSATAISNRSTRSAEPQTSSPTPFARVEQPGEATGSLSPHTIRLRIGLLTALLFLTSFIAVIVTRGLLTSPPLPLDLFANMYLAGTIIFGGGPVVIPLLRSYVVDPGWVSSRDFLLGLAIIQAFPGPNFNFGVYLGVLAIQRSQFASILGAFLGYVGIFAPGITLAVVMQSFWRVLRSKKWVIDLLRGINATAVGLVFTAVYRLWEMGYLTPQAAHGQSLALEPWWVVVAAVTYAESAWFGVAPPWAIGGGAVLGLLWYAAVGR